jgi:hypothetical protein
MHFDLHCSFVVYFCVLYKFILRSFMEQFNTVNWSNSQLPQNIKYWYHFIQKYKYCDRFFSMKQSEYTWKHYLVLIQSLHNFSYCFLVCMYLFEYLTYWLLRYIERINCLLCLQLQQLITDMKDIYSRARICPHRINSINYSYRQSGNCDLALDPGKTNQVFFQIITKADHYILCSSVWYMP